MLLCDGQGSPLVVAALKVSRKQANMLANEIANFLGWNVVDDSRTDDGNLQDLTERPQHVGQGKQGETQPRRRTRPAPP
jgi:hypothetical protein